MGKHQECGIKPNRKNTSYLIFNLRQYTALFKGLKLEFQEYKYEFT